MDEVVDYIGKIVRKHDWLVGGQNFDEDLHFSSFYMRQSSKKYLGPQSETGYETIIAVYRDFNEVYYIPTAECRRVARYLLSKLKRRPAWMDKVIAEIYKCSEELNKVFAEHDARTEFSTMSDTQLMDLYRKHRSVHLRLYAVARIPEALDRGEEAFTDYLKKYLNEQCKLSDEGEANELFSTLTMPTEPSIFQEETLELLDIAHVIEALGQRGLFQNQDRRLTLKVEPSIALRVRAHAEKWGFLDYHGYGRRELPDFSDYAQKIGTYFRSAVKWRDRNQCIRAFKKVKARKSVIFSRYRIDATHRELFELYGRIGLAKLFRRYIQLRNFYFLDKLMEQIALRTGHEEGLIRCLLPEEIEALMDRKFAVDSAVRKRLEFIAYVIDGQYEGVASGREQEWIKESLNSLTQGVNPAANELQGTPVSKGYARGTCRVVHRPGDILRTGFRNGDILVSESTDPDLRDAMARSGGVVTQQGGVTSHASIICRELGKPAVVGVRYLLETIRSGDQVILDARRGSLRILERTWTRELVVKPDHLDTSDPQLLKVVGGKAVGLLRLREAGFLVPKFFVVPVTLFTSSAEKTAQLEQDFGMPRGLTPAVANASAEFSTSEVAIRSSFVSENGQYESMAGLYPTWVNIERPAVVTRLKEYMNELFAKYGRGLKGGIIIQEMIHCDTSGVCFTVDPVSHDRRILVIEVVRGFGGSLTDGRQNPDVRLRVDKRGYDILTHELLSRQWGTEEDPSITQHFREMVRTFLQVEQYFGSPQDVEWALSKGKLYILQSRPVTTVSAPED